MRRVALSLLLATLTAVSFFPTGAAGAAATASGDRKATHDHPTNGQVHRDLRPAAAGGPCKGHGFDVGDGTDPSCTHGPDPAPDTVDVTRERTTEEIATASEAITSTGGSIECDSDGAVGNRIQAVYAVSSDRADRFSSLTDSLAGYAKKADAVFNNSAAKTGGVRHLRWVTNANADGTCSPSILKVVMSATGDDSFANTKTELKAKGLNRTDRKYLVWTDATVYCGIANVSHDDRPTQDNPNNGGSSSVLFGRVDTGCWGATASTEAHEITHLLGGVQPSAPNGTYGFHCTDESDRLCYNDGSGEPMTYPCSGGEALLDCNNDDYFHTSPPAGSYLASYWNVANSSFLLTTGSATPPPPPSPDLTPPAPPTNLQATAGDARVSLTWTGVADATQYRIYRNGVATTATASTSSTVTGLTNGTTSTFEVTALDAAGNESARSNLVTATPASRRKVRASSNR